LFSEKRNRELVALFFAVVQNAVIRTVSFMI